MQHARTDYQRFQDPAVTDPSLLSEGSTPIGEDEPVFLLRAQDRAAPLAVRAYANLADSFGAHDIAAAARIHADRMLEWQDAHQQSVKVPDAPDGSLAHTALNSLAKGLLRTMCIQGEVRLG